MSARRSISWASALSDLRADRGQNAGAKIAAKRQAELQAMKDRNRAAAASKADGAVGYELRPIGPASTAIIYRITLDGLAVGKAVRDPTSKLWCLLANRGLNEIPIRFPNWVSNHASIDGICGFLGARVTGA